MWFMRAAHVRESAKKECRSFVWARARASNYFVTRRLRVIGFQAHLCIWTNWGGYFDAALPHWYWCCSVRGALPSSRFSIVFFWFLVMCCCGKGESGLEAFWTFVVDVQSMMRIAFCWDKGYISVCYFNIPVYPAIRFFHPKCAQKG